MKIKKIVTIGGGTGSFMLLSGLKKYPINISAIVSMADDGGSTGVLRDELGVLPPGDVRQCLVALSDSSEILRELMNYRFERGKLKGHSFGNLFLSALEKIKGDFVEGVEEAAEILDIKGEVIPVSNQKMVLKIKLKNGKIIFGESNLDHNEAVRQAGIKNVSLKKSAAANPKALERIKKADFIIIGPGDLFGSIIPNLLVEGIGGAVRKSSAKVIYNCNLVNKKGQTENFSLEDYVQKIEEYIGQDRINFVIFNRRKLSEKLVKKYEKREGKGSVVEIKKQEACKKYKVIVGDILNKQQAGKSKSDHMSARRSFIRHDSEKLSKLIVRIARLNNR
jgi:uncharacterized cofD-like protein